MSVVVTGTGVVSALGPDPSAFRRALMDGVNACAMHEWERFDGEVVKAPAYPAVKPEPEGLIEPRKLRRMFRLARMSAVAARQALQQAGIKPETLDPARIGVVFGTSFGAMEVTQRFVDSWLKNGVAAASPLQFMNSVHGILASQIALDIGATGVNLTTAQRDICFEAALDLGRDALMTRRADVVLVGGADEITPMLHEFGSRALQVSTAPAKGLDPWGAAQGVIPGDGAGVVVLERDETPRKPLARLLATEVGRHDAPGEDRAVRAWRNAGEPGVDLITNNRDGGRRSALVNDRREPTLKDAGGAPPMLSHRGNFGTYPAAGAQQFIANVLMLSHGEFYRPLANGQPTGEAIEAPQTILHDAPSISGNHAAYVLSQSDNTQ